jgi:hypothetical protein
MKRCPGCSLEMPEGRGTLESYYNTSPECWSVYTEVLGAEFQNAPLFGQVHSLTVDAYAAQHAGGRHPDKSVCIHLIGLHLVLDRGVAPTGVARHHQRLATAVKAWPHFPPPENRGTLTVYDVATAASSEEHARLVRLWAAQVWQAWRDHHPAISALASQHLDLPTSRPQGLPGPQQPDSTSR